MKTIQINDYMFPKQKKKQWDLLKDIYKKFLQNDDTFHYLFEPELIIRIKNEQTIASIKSYLDKKHFLYKIYDYPKTKSKLNFGETEKVMLNHADIILPILHGFSVYYLSVSDKEREKDDFRERIIHLVYNTAQFNGKTEASSLAGLAVGRAFVTGFYTRNI